jgi:hypothetical protein
MNQSQYKQKGQNMKKSEQKKRMYLHGECMIAEIDALPEGLRQRDDKDSIMIAESETVGNEHRIKVKEGVEFFEDVHGILYMRNTVPTEVYCLHEERHDTIELPEGLWQIDKAKEYDYLNAKVVFVTD